MELDRDLIAAILREMHGRPEVEDAVLTETAQRVKMLLSKLRLADERRLQPVAPAFSFDPAAESYKTDPVVGRALYAAMAAAPGSSGYGGSGGTTGSGAVSPPERPAQPDGPEYLEWPAHRMAEAIARRELSPVELAEAALERISALDPALNAFVTVMADSALAEARRAEARLSKPSGGPLGPLHGVPIALKDIYETAGVRTAAGSCILSDYVPQADATPVRRLRAAGAIILGKTATHEFAFGALTDSPFHGPTRNPWDTRRTPGGSSGGSGAAVAAAMVPIAMGTDTGGSIRMPASCCGVVGLKPTYGRCSKAGVLPLSWSLDHVGPIAATVRDAALVLAVIAGPDPADPSALPVPIDDYIAAAEVPPDLRGTRIGVPAAWLDTRRVDGEVLAQFEAGLRRFAELGARVEEVALPEADLMTLVNRLLTLGEAGAYHAPFLKDQARDYAPDVRLRMELGAHLSARDYLLGQRLRGEIAREVHQIMARVDAIALPTMPVYPALIGQPMWEFGSGEREAVVEAMVRFPAPFSVTGQPAFSLPCGLTEAGIPVGLQLVGRPFGEAALIRIAAAFEAAGGVLRRPTLVG